MFSAGMSAPPGQMDGQMDTDGQYIQQDAGTLFIRSVQDMHFIYRTTWQSKIN